MTKINTPNRMFSKKLEEITPIVQNSVYRFLQWLYRYGEVSQDFQDYYNSSYGCWAKNLYYRYKLIGKVLVAPLVFLEAFAPWTRRLFYQPQRFPIADAHYASAYIFLYKLNGNLKYKNKAYEFLKILEKTRCKNYLNYCWGYPFDWTTVWGKFKSGTPLITITPYCYEAFSDAYYTDKDPRLLEIMFSIVKHVVNDYNENEYETGIWASSYSPIDNRKVVNANAYRAYLLTAASKDFNDKKYWEMAKRYLNFVLNVQNKNGSWYYAMDDYDKFIDHFHTCFVMKALAKIEIMTGDEGCRYALRRATKYFMNELIDKNGYPRPFSIVQRLTIYKKELYDYAEAINLSLLLRRKFPEYDRVLYCAISDLIKRWQMKNGCFRIRKQLIGWNNVPMHRWGLSQVIRALCYFLYDMNNN